MAVVDATVANPASPERRLTLSLLLDSGFAYTVIPSGVLASLGIEPVKERTFILANGQPVKRWIGEARITFQGESATCVVMFGEEGDNALLGVTTLENLGLIFDPMRQKIMPLPMMLAEAKRLFAD